jgi:hypothetical protein
MTFLRFINIILRSMLLNVWLLMLCFCLSLPLDGDVLFVSGGSQSANLLLLFLFVINFFHWAMEIMGLFIKITRDDEDF